MKMNHIVKEVMVMRQQFLNLTDQLSNRVKNFSDEFYSPVSVAEPPYS